MKKCIIALLLGFDEVRVFKERYSIPTARVDTYHFWPNQRRNSFFDYNLITVFHAENTHSLLDTHQPKYEYCIAISLLEPIPKDMTAHYNVFEQVRKILIGIDGWYAGFKMIIRHHSLDDGTNSITFDHGLMQERFFPGSNTEGFIRLKTHDLRHFDTRQADQSPFILKNLSRAKVLSQEITDRTKTEMNLFTLASWINQMIPMAPAFERNLFNVHNPFQITMGGCYAGRGLMSGNHALILRFLSVLQAHFNSSFINIIGATSWTFYNDWRAVSFCTKYFDHEPNEDPFRGVASASEKDFFIKIPDDMRRYYLSKVSWEPKTGKYVYSQAGVQDMRSGSGLAAQLPIEHDQNKIDWHAFKSDIFNMLMEAATTDVVYTRIPGQITEIIQNITRNLVPKFTYKDILSALRISLGQINAKIQEVDSIQTSFNSVMINIKIVLEFFIAYAIDKRYFKVYTSVCKKFNNVIEQLYDITTEDMGFDAMLQNAMFKELHLLEQIFESNCARDYAADFRFLEYHDCQRLTFLILKGKNITEFFLDDISAVCLNYFRPLSDIIARFEDQILRRLDQPAVHSRNSNLLPPLKEYLQKMHNCIRAELLSET